MVIEFDIHRLGINRRGDVDGRLAGAELAGGKFIGQVAPVARPQVAQLEEQLAGEPELLTLLRKFEAEYDEFNRELEEVAADYAAGDTVAGVEAIHIAAAAEVALEAELAELGADTGELPDL